jgi:hypothetical protein
MKQIIFIFYIFIILIIKTKQSTLCNEVNCYSPNGKCIHNKCICNYGYKTFELKENNGKYCTYKQITRWLPLILEIFLPSVGHFIIGKTYIGIFKLTLVIIPITCMCIGFCMTQPASEDALNQSGNIEREKPLCELITFGLAVISLILLLIMQIIDIILFLIPYYKDGNGIPLI